MSAVVTVWYNKFYGGFRLRDFSRMSFSRNFLSVMLVMKFDMSKSSFFISLNSQFFSSVISFFQCFSGVPCSSCLAQKKSPRQWYVFRVGNKHSRNSSISLSVLIVSGSVLNSPFVIISIADGQAPSMISCLISGSVVSHGSPVGAVLSVSININFVDSFYVLPKSFGPLFGCVQFVPVEPGVF